MAATLVEMGGSVSRVASHADVLVAHRLAIGESDRAPAIARTLDSSGREANDAALRAWLATAQATNFLAVLWGGY
jgi:hypothetical protein